MRFAQWQKMKPCHLNQVKGRVVFPKKFSAAGATQKIFLEISTLNKLPLTWFIFRATGHRRKTQKADKGKGFRVFRYVILARKNISL